MSRPLRSESKKPRPPLSDRVYEHLLDRLLTRRLLPGELLNRRTVAAELELSATPVLEAMLRLEGEGLLETLPRKGTRIALADAEEIRGRLLVREALECQAARMYCGAPVAARAEGLKRLGARVDRAPRESLERWRLEVDFHRSLVELSGSAPLLREFSRVMRVSLFFSLHSPHLSILREGGHPHPALVEELRTRNPERAERAMRRHLRAGKRY